MKPAFFITGTDTGVGKTFITAQIARAMRRKGIDVGVMKPVETGCPVKGGRLVPSDALLLKEASGSKDPLDLINPFRFKNPLAPAVASRLEGVTIDMAKIKKSFDELLRRHEAVLIEGAGGLLTPITGKKTMADLAQALSTPLVIIVANRLGAINHALLTIHCARCSGGGGGGGGIAGVIINNVTPGKDPSAGTNTKEITRLSGINIISEVPFLRGASFKAGLFKKAVERLMKVKPLPGKRAGKEREPSYIDY